jgi:hypothetical protein
MENSQRYPFIASDTEYGEAGFRPYLPISLSFKGKAVGSKRIQRLFLSIRIGF